MTRSRTRDCWLSFFVGVALCGFLALYFQRSQADPPSRWLRVEVIFGKWHEFKRFRLGPLYHWRRRCERSIAPDGWETIGAVTTWRQFECVRLRRVVE